MSDKGILLSRRMKIWFYSVFGVLFFSGVIWLAVNFYPPSQKTTGLPVDEYEGVFASVDVRRGASLSYSSADNPALILKNLHATKLVLDLGGATGLPVGLHAQNGDEIMEWHHTLQTWLLKIHGAAAMASLVIFGVMISTHMQRAWKKRRNLVAAVALVALCLLMVVSGYGLYYCGDEALRSWISGVHNATGYALPVILFWHIVSGRKTRKIRKN